MSYEGDAHERSLTAKNLNGRTHGWTCYESEVLFRSASLHQRPTSILATPCNNLILCCLASLKSVCDLSGEITPWEDGEDLSWGSACDMFSQI